MLLGLVLSENSDTMRVLKQSLPSGSFYDVAGEKTHNEHLSTQIVCAQNQTQIRACEKDQTFMQLTVQNREMNELKIRPHGGAGEGRRLPCWSKQLDKGVKF